MSSANDNEANRDANHDVDEPAPAAASFHRPRAVAFLGQKVFERRQEERAESALPQPHVTEVVLLDEQRKVSLREVMGVLSRITQPAGEAIQGTPVGRTQKGKRLPRPGLGATARSRNGCPSGARKGAHRCERRTRH